MRSFDGFQPGTREGLFFSRTSALDTTTMLPIVLLLFRSAEVSGDRRRRALAALESWLVRRAILRLTSKNYNRTLTSLLAAIKADLPHADEALARELRSSQAVTALWPSDDAVRARLQHGDLYGYVGQARVRMLLEACELDARDPAKAEAVPLPAGLSIEHALPQAWEEHWPGTTANSQPASPAPTASPGSSSPKPSPARRQQAHPPPATGPRHSPWQTPASTPGTRTPPKPQPTPTPSRPRPGPSPPRAHCPAGRNNWQNPARNTQRADLTVKVPTQSLPIKKARPAQTKIIGHDY